MCKKRSRRELLLNLSLQSKSRSLLPHRWPHRRHLSRVLLPLFLPLFLPLLLPGKSPLLLLPGRSAPLQNPPPPLLPIAVVEEATPPALKQEDTLPALPSKDRRGTLHVLHKQEDILQDEKGIPPDHPHQEGIPQDGKDMPHVLHKQEATRLVEKGDILLLDRKGTPSASNREGILPVPAAIHPVALPLSVDPQEQALPQVLAPLILHADPIHREEPLAVATSPVPLSPAAPSSLRSKKGIASRESLERNRANSLPKSSASISPPRKQKTREPSTLEIDKVYAAIPMRPAGERGARCTRRARCSKRK